MRGFESLKKTGDFQPVYQGGSSRVNRTLVMIIKRNDLKRNRYGISVSKKVGNSVVRHRVIRVIREIIRINDKDIDQGYDIVIVARTRARSGDYHEIRGAFEHLLKLHHLLKDDDLE